MPSLDILNKISYVKAYYCFFYSKNKYLITNDIKFYCEKTSENCCRIEILVISLHRIWERMLLVRIAKIKMVW